MTVQQGALKQTFPLKLAASEMPLWRCQGPKLQLEVA
jgi:hypothetical protein